HSNTSQDALPLAKVHAHAFQAEVYVVTSMVSGTGEQQEKINAAAKGLAYAKDYFKKDGLACETHLLIRGLSPGEDLVNFAKEHVVDEIIVGVRKRSRVGKFLTGSTTQYIILMANCPVVSVRNLY
ncbi:MAG: universal stress protein, partial [Deltaproteobacteria bacterium]|nr:universal stress protein [Deltaproteobacteria bacterium]